MFVRTLAASGAVAILCLFSTGCNCVSHSQTPIVGDSMSMGCTYEGGMPAGDCASGMCGNGGEYASDGNVIGCAGGGCDGRCGGRCALAQMRMRMANRAANLGAGRHGIAAAIDCNHRRCANGACGGVAGPEAGAVTYPYYTLRGPRDFLMSNPPSIGP